jgi:hypothetical protein
VLGSHPPSIKVPGCYVEQGDGGRREVSGGNMKKRRAASSLAKLAVSVLLTAEMCICN